MTKKNNTKKKNRKKTSFINKFLKAIFFLFIFIIVISFIGLIIFFPKLNNLKNQSSTIIDNIKKEDFTKSSISQVYDKNNKKIFELKQDKTLHYITYDKIPDNFKNSFISIEDKRYWDHKGVDYKGILRAAISIFNNNGEITQGGSTITQQLVKLTYLTNEKTLDRKIKEVFISKALENTFSKEEILEFYLNNIYFGNNIYGINAASNFYFNKSVDKLSLSQIAFLTAIPNNPTLFDPFNNKDNVLKRRNLILGAMKEQNYISDSDYNAALSEKITVSKNRNKGEKYDNRKDFVKKEMVEIFMIQNGFEFKYDFKTYSEKENYQKHYDEVFEETKTIAFNKGYKVYTSFDDNLQKENQKIIDDRFKYENEKNSDNIYKLQGSSVTLDNKTGLILSMIGGRTSPSTDYLDRSSSAFRQNGSSMKPIGVYGPSFDILGYTPSTIKNDSKESGGPSNSTGYFGNITLRKAIEKSSNTVTSKVFKEVTPIKGMAYLQEMCFENIVPDDMRPPSALGGLTIGTNTKEMAGAYAAIANKGKFNKPSSIVKIVANNGEVVYEHTPMNKSVYKESSAVMLIDAMKGVLTKGTARGTTLSNNIEAAGKTGTTTNNKDGWFVGSTEMYTTAVWIGYDTPKTVYNMYGNIRPASIWRDIMNTTHKNIKDLKFDKGDSVVEVWINSSGERVPDGMGTLEIFPKTNIPSENKQIFEDKARNDFLSEIKSIFSLTLTKDTDLTSLKKSINTLKNKITNSNLSTSDKSDLINNINENYIITEKKIEELKNPPLEVTPPPEPPIEENKNPSPEVPQAN